MSKLSLKTLVQEELKKPVGKLTAGWQPIVQKTEEVKIVENFNPKPRSGLKSLLEVNTDMQPTVKKNQLDELVQTPVIQIQEQKESIVIKVSEPVVEKVIVSKPVVEAAEIKIIKEETLIDKASAYISSRTKNEDSYQQPVAVTPANFSEVARKVKFLEEWIGKVSMSGPGSGEVRLLRLDDVNYQSWQNRDEHKILKFSPNANPAFDGVTFGFLTGDQGEIFSLKYNPYTGYTSNANVAPGLTYYDPERDTLEVLHKDGSATYVGQDNFIRFKNGNANTIHKGSLVRFVGSDLVSNVPFCDLYVSDVTSTPLYITGVSVTDCEPDTLGRAMLLGEVEDFNASGSAVGENWGIGDLLWASPTVPGQLTNIRPTSPNVVVSIAAVMNNSSTTGRILVRPTIWPRLLSGDFYSTQIQTAPNINFAHQITFSNTLFTSGVTRTGNVITVSEAGLYKFDLRLQLSSTNSNEKSLVAWFKKDNVNVPYSSVRQSVATNGGYSVLTNTQTISLTPTDNVTMFYAVTSTSLFIDSPNIIDDSASIPSVQLTVTQPAL
jgi:hypothetical protein